MSLALGAALLAAAPLAAAYAAPGALPDTDDLYTIECDTARGTVPALQLFRIASDTAVLTAVGTGDATVADDNCAGPTASVDPSTNLVYFIDQTRDETSLTRMNPVTGASTVIAEFRLASNPAATYEVDALTIDPQGKAFVVRQGELASVDLATGLVTPIGDGDSGSLNNIYALVAHPSSGVIYGISSNGAGVLYSFDPVSGEATSITSITQTNIYGAAFDSSGTLWVTNYVGATNATELASVDVANWTASYTSAGPLTLATNPTYVGYYTQSLFLTSEAWPDATDPDEPGDGIGSGAGGEELAATGARGDISLSIMGGALASLIAGGALLALRRPKRSEH
jgi:LPXTG-motif cell wall-anchored protein